MIVSEGRFLRQRPPAFAARVQIEIETEVTESIILFYHQGESLQDEISTLGYIGCEWRVGAVVGIEYALRICGVPPCQIKITRILGSHMDTNPTIVAGAAIDAVWKAFDFQPPEEIKNKVEQQVLHSWRLPDQGNAIPIFS